MSDTRPTPVTIDDIRAATRTIAGAVTRTPCLRSETLSQMTGADVWLKLENLQYTASFKERGALNRLLALDDKEKARGVIAMSAGNHAQAVAFHATRLGIPATIVMPTDTPFIKVTNTELLGATIVLHGDSLEETAKHAERLREDKNLVLVHPYDDPLIIAGQGTTALEMLDEMPGLDVMVVPIGGGGLISGCAIAAKAIKPDMEIIGVQAALFASMPRALKGKIAQPQGATIADGIAVKSPGKLTRKIIADLVDRIDLVEESRIEHAVHLLVEIEKMVVEGAGAVPLAALLQEGDRYVGRSVGLIISGGNIDSRTLATVLMRGLIGAGRLMRLRVELPDAPGSLSRVTALIASLGGNIVEVEHNRWFRDVPARMSGVDFLVEIRQSSDGDAIIRGIVTAGLKARRMSSDAVGD
jgi:threonine dehydratase